MYFMNEQQNRCTFNDRLLPGLIKIDRESYLLKGNFEIMFWTFVDFDRLDH